MFNILKKKLADWIGSSSKKAVESKETIEKPIADNSSKKDSKKIQAPKPAVKEVKKSSKRDSIVDEKEVVVQKEKTDEVISEIPIQPKKGFFGKLKSVFSSKEITEEFFSDNFNDLELILLENNVALSVVDSIKDKMSSLLVGREFDRSEIPSKIKDALRQTIDSLLVEPQFDIIKHIKESPSTVKILFCGINGSGKTTTLAKFAHLLKKNNISCVFAAGDTFRAASIEQLSIHASNLGVHVVKQTYGSDPAAVAYDAIQYAQAKKIKVVLIDTAGRMHTKQNLMDEMGKIVRVSKPDFKIFVGESITGNDATEQARIFNDSIGIDGIILTKADIDEKGGTAISVSKVTGKPILFLGTGQGYDSLESFDKDKIFDALGL